MTTHTSTDIFTGYAADQRAADLEYARWAAAESARIMAKYRATDSAATADRFADRRCSTFAMATAAAGTSDVIIRRAVMEAAARAAVAAARDAMGEDADDDGEYSTSDYRIFGDFAVSAAVDMIHAGDFLVSGYGYRAAFVNRDGTLRLVTQHAADNGRSVSYYGQSWSEGRVRLCISETSLKVHLGPCGITARQVQSIGELVESLDISTVIPELPNAYPNMTKWGEVRHYLLARIVDHVPAATAAAPLVTPTSFATAAARTTTVAPAAPVVATVATVERPTPRRYRTYAASNRRYYPRHIRPRPNAYAADCAGCGRTVAAGLGTLTRTGGRWIVRCDSCT